MTESDLGTAPRERTLEDPRAIDRRDQLYAEQQAAFYAEQRAANERRAAGCERCGLLSHNGLRGSEAHAIMLKAGCVACPVCDEFECTKNHSEFT